MTLLRPLLLASIPSALVGGLVGGIVASSMGAAPPPKTDQEKPKTESSESSDLDPRAVTRLETRLAELEGRVSALRRQREAVASLKDYAKAMAEGDTEATGTKQPSAPGVVDAEDPVFELAVRSVMDRVEWEKDEEKKVTRAQRRSERTQRHAELLTERLALSDEQAKAVGAALNKQMETFRKLREEGENGEEERPATRAEWRERVGKIRSQTERELGEILDEEQMKGYRAFAEEEGVGPGGWGRRDRQLRERPAPE